MRKRSVLFFILFCALFFGETRGGISSASFLADDNLHAALNEATILKDLYDYDKAERVFENLPEELKNLPQTLLLLGRIHYLSGREAEAVAVFKKFLKAERPPEEKAFAWTNLGLCYEKTGDVHNAVKSFKEALALYPDDFVSHAKLGHLYEKRGKPREALVELDTARRIDSSDLSVQRKLAGLFEKERNFEEALFLYRKISLADSEDRISKKKTDDIARELGREYAERENQKRDLEKKSKPVFVKAPHLPSSAKVIRIELARGEKNIEFKSSSDFVLKKVGGQTILGPGHGGRLYLALARNDRTIYLKHNAEPPLTTATIYDGIIIEPLTKEATTTLFGLEKAKGEYWARKEDRIYRGRIEIRVNKNGLSVVNIVSLEEYLYGVVPSEMPSSWPREALKAQAVAARSEALSKIDRHQNEGFDLCDEVHCQVYRGVDRENQLVNKFIDETRGLIMTSQGKLVDALYSSSCGGHTQDNIFGEREEISYLKGSPEYEFQGKSFPLSPYWLDQWLRFPDREILCNLPGVLPRGQFRWVRTYPSEEINRMVNKLGNVGNVKEVLVLKREKSGHISSLKINGTKSSIVLDKELVIRKIFGNLRSSLFKLEIKKTKEGLPEEFIFFGGGWGHGVGMCQSGAYGLAVNGKTFSDILARYFKGMRLEKFY